MKISEECNSDDCQHCDDADCKCGCHRTIFDDEDDADFGDDEDDSYWSGRGSDY